MTGAGLLRLEHAKVDLRAYERGLSLAKSKTEEAAKPNVQPTP
jgi:hypothetical protein